MWRAVRYVLRVRTNVVIIVASALGYFFFAGLRSFAVIFATGHYGISKPTATALIVVIGAGALAGVFTGGRVADRRLGRGHVRARVLVPAVCRGGSGGGGTSQAGNATGLEYTFLVFGIPLIIAGLLSLAALRTYPRDVATASASVRAINDIAGPDEEPGGQHAA